MICIFKTGILKSLHPRRAKISYKLLKTDVNFENYLYKLSRNKDKTEIL